MAFNSFEKLLQSNYYNDIFKAVDNYIYHHRSYISVKSHTVEDPNFKKLDDFAIKKVLSRKVRDGIIVSELQVIASLEIKGQTKYGYETDSANLYSNKVIGGHSPKIDNSNPNYATQTVITNNDGTASVDFVKQLDNGEISNIKHSTLFPQTWSGKDIIDSIKSVGEDVPLAIRTSDGATFHRKAINGVSIDVIKRGPDVISGYPTGSNLSYPRGF